jgi:hypothetical protein
MLKVSIRQATVEIIQVAEEVHTKVGTTKTQEQSTVTEGTNIRRYMTVH